MPNNYDANATQSHVFFRSSARCRRTKFSMEWKHLLCLTTFKLFKKCVILPFCMHEESFARSLPPLSSSSSNAHTWARIQYVAMGDNNFTHILSWWRMPPPDLWWNSFSGMCDKHIFLYFHSERNQIKRRLHTPLEFPSLIRFFGRKIVL